MKKRVLSFIMCLGIVVSLLSGMTFAEEKSEAIVILYENDVHCAVDGYSKLAAMKKEMSEKYNYVGVVSSGDYLQGGSLGVISQGEYIVNLMNLPILKLFFQRLLHFFRLRQNHHPRSISI